MLGDYVVTSVQGRRGKRSRSRHMPIRIPAAELYQIQEEDLWNAIGQFREGALPRTFKDSVRFDLLVDGYKRFPPKAITALAAQRPLGRVLSSGEFTGGESS